MSKTKTKNLLKQFAKEHRTKEKRIEELTELEGYLLVFISRSMDIIDEYLNAGSKEQRKAASEQGKKIYEEYYGEEYKNKVDR